MESFFVYIDESGDPSLDVEKKGVSQCLVYAAVVIRESDVVNARQLLAEIHNKYFSQNHYLKSQHIPNDHNGYVKTISILTDLIKLKHFVYALVIDKSRINKQSGLSYKKVFIKFFNRFIAQRLISQDGDIHIYFDKTGYAAFQNELTNYMQEHGVCQNLFSNNTFELAEDKDEEQLLQMADFYAGTINKYYCGNFDKNKGNIIHNNFLRKNVSVEWFPYDILPLFAVADSFESNYNEEITKIAIQSATNYMEKHPDDRIGIELIRYILQETHKNPLRYISSKEIKANLKLQNVEISDPIVKISELRNKGVLIISPIGKKGYKIPNSEQEIAEFYNRLSGNVIPQLRRCFILNKMLLDKSKGRYNMLSSNEFELLSALCELSVKNNSHVSPDL